MHSSGRPCPTRKSIVSLALHFHLAMIKIAGVKSNDKINFKEFVDFFNKVD